MAESQFQEKTLTCLIQTGECFSWNCNFGTYYTLGSAVSASTFAISFFVVMQSPGLGLLAGAEAIILSLQPESLQVLLCGHRQAPTKVERSLIQDGYENQQRYVPG